MKNIFRVNLLVLVLVLGFVCSVTAQEFVQGEVIVKLKPDASSAMLASVSAPGAMDSATVLKSAGGAMVIQLADKVAVTSAVALLSADPAVEYAEPNWILYATATPNDPQQGSQWAWGKIDAYDAWDITTGDPDIVVNVIDTGIDTDHEDLVGNVWTNTAEAGGTPGFDDDGNGYIDDIHGWNAIANNGNPEDDNDHGTHCSGTIGAVTNNATGVAGVNWTASVVACKFLSTSGSGTSVNAIECVDYIIATKNAGTADIRVSSNSWGGGGASAAMSAAIQSAVNEGILWVNAAGNNSCNNDCFCSGAYPASYNVDGIISVAATSSTDSMASFSEYGASTVDIGAPGVSIVSTTTGDTYSSYGGTSMACPHVAGVAALTLAANPALTVTELREAILCNGDFVSSMDGNTRTGMRLNALGAVTAATGGSTCNDRDSDGVPDYADNCPYDSNSGQSDADSNGVGDDCEPTDCGGCF